IQRLVCVLEVSGLRVSLSQQAEVGRDAYLRPGGPKGAVTLEDQWHRLLAPAPQEQPRPLVERAQGLPELETLFGRDGRLFLGRRLDLGPESAVKVEEGRKIHGMAEAERVADRPSQRLRLTIQSQGLVRIAQVPQSQRKIAAVGHAGIVVRI